MRGLPRLDGLEAHAVSADNRHDVKLDRVWFQGIRQPNGCLLWTGRLDDQGYGRISPTLGATSIHRLAYRMFYGPIPAGLTIDHTCHHDDPDCYAGPRCPHRRCFEPTHLELATQSVNASLRRAPQRRVTHCRMGHPYDAANTYVTKEGWRRCKTCVQAATEVWRDKDGNRQRDNEQRSIRRAMGR